MTNTDLTKANETALSVEDQELMSQLKTGSGESENSQSYTSIPYLTVDNSMVEEELKSGKKVPVRCNPLFLMNEKIGEEYTKTPFADEFEGVILGFRHRVQRKYIQRDGVCTNELDFYKSLEFKSFKSELYIYQNKAMSEAMTYQDVKGMSPEGKENELWMIVYFVIKGEDTVRKAEFKGASRGVIFDYMTEKRDDSVSSFYTKFSLEVVTGEIPYNKVILTRLEERPNLSEVVGQQKDLNLLLDLNSTPMKPSLITEVMTEIISDKTATVEAIEEMNVEDVFAKE